MSILNKTIWTSAIILAICAMVYPKFEIKILKTDIRCNRSIADCMFSSIGSAFNWELMLHKELLTLNMDLQFTMHQRNSIRYQTLANVSQDYCQFVKSQYKDQFAGLFWNLMNVGNKNRLIDRCPVKPVNQFYFFI